MVRNMPGTTSIAAIPLLAQAGATEIEPGHALTGSTPFHAVRDLEEVPAVAYVSEVSHHFEGSAFVIGGGLYRDPVLGEQATRALAFAPDGTPLGEYDVEMPAPSAIDYYSIIPPTGTKSLPPVGSTVVFGFRVQAFVTRAQTAGITGISTGDPHCLDAYAASGSASFLTQGQESS
jgi:predicted amino acid racemase